MAGAQSHVLTLPSISKNNVDSRLSTPALMQQKTKISAPGVNTVQQKTLKGKRLQLQAELDEQQTHERVCHHYEEYELAGFQHTSPGSQQVNQISEMFQQLYIAKSPSASQVNVPLDQHVAVQRNQVTTRDSVNAVSQAVSSALSSTPNGEANWERLADDHSTDETGQDQLTDPSGYDPAVD